MTTKIRTRLPNGRVLGAILAILMLIAAACGDDDAASVASDTNFQRVADDLDEGGGGSTGGDATSGDFGDTGSDNFVETDGEPAAQAPDDEDQGGSNVSQVDTGTTSANDFGRSVIRVAEATVEVDDVPAASLSLQTAMSKLGAVVFNETTNAGKQNTTTIEFRMRPRDFQEALGLLKGAGKLVQQTITTDDVTERLSDLESRIDTAEVSVERLRGFLANATTLTDISSLEQQLLERESALEVLRGQQRTIADQVALATVIVTLRETSAPEIEAIAELAVTAYSGDDGGAGCPGFDELRVDEGQPVTLCLSIENTGSSPLGRFGVADHGLDLDRRDFTFEGVTDLKDLVLAPDATVIGWATTEAPAAGHSNIEISAVALDEDGESVRVAAVIEQLDELSLRFEPDNSLPGFLDGMEATWAVVVGIGALLILIAGAAIPLFWLPLLLWAAWRWSGRKWLHGRAATPPPPQVDAAG